MNILVCHICNVPATEMPLYRDGPKGQKAPFICETCKIERGEEVERDDIVDLIDEHNQGQVNNRYKIKLYVKLYINSSGVSVEASTSDWPSIEKPVEEWILKHTPEGDS